MTIRKLHSHNTNSTRASIAKDYTELYFDDATNSILLPDPTGVLETKIGAAANPTGLKGFASGFVDAGTFITLDNLKFTVTTSGQRGLCCTTVSGTSTLAISAHYAMVGGVAGTATNWSTMPTYNSTTVSGSWFGWSFPNAGDTSTYNIQDVNNQRFYRVTLMIGPGYTKNFISVERLY